MTVALVDMLKQMEELSLTDLLALQEKLNGQLQIKKTFSISNASPSSRYLKSPWVYQPTLEEVEASFAENFTPEQLAAMDAVDLNNLPVGEKSLSEMIIEDREDRF